MTANDRANTFELPSLAQGVSLTAGSTGNTVPGGAYIDTLIGTAPTVGTTTILGTRAAVFAPAAATTGILAYTGDSDLAGSTVMLVRFDTLPTAGTVVEFAQLRSASANMIRWTVTGAGVVALQNAANGVPKTFSTTFVVGKWYRFELGAAIASSSPGTANGTINAGVYEGLSKTPLEAVYSVTNGNVGTLNYNTFRVGVSSSGGTPQNLAMTVKYMRAVAGQATLLGPPAGATTASPWRVDTTGTILGSVTDLAAAMTDADSTTGTAGPSGLQVVAYMAGAVSGQGLDFSMDTRRLSSTSGSWSVQLKENVAGTLTNRGSAKVVSVPADTIGTVTASWTPPEVTAMSIVDASQLVAVATLTVA